MLLHFTTNESTPKKLSIESSHICGVIDIPNAKNLGCEIFTSAGDYFEIKESYEEVISLLEKAKRTSMIKVTEYTTGHTLYINKSEVGTFYGKSGCSTINTINFGTFDVSEKPKEILQQMEE